MNWIVILLVLAALFIFVKMTNKGQNFWSYIIVVASIFFVVTVIYVSTLPGVSLTSLDGLVQLSKLYFIWLGKLASNLGSLTGNAVRLDWSANFTG